MGEGMGGHGERDQVKIGETGFGFSPYNGLPRGILCFVWDLLYFSSFGVFEGIWGI